MPALLAGATRIGMLPTGPADLAGPAGAAGQAGTVSRARRAPLLAWAPLALALVAGLGGPLAYSLDTVNTTHTGAIPSAGPQLAGAFGRLGGGPGGFGGATGQPGAGFGTATGTGTGTGGGTAAGGPPSGTGGTSSGTSGTVPGGTGGFPGVPGSSTGTGGNGGTGSAGAQGGFGGFGGGLSGSTQVSSALIKFLEQDAAKYRWIAATEGSRSAAPIELATGGDAVMAIGGFNGTDPAPTLAEFKAMVAAHEIHYYVGRGGNSFGGGSGSSAIASWVAANFTAKTVGDVTVYDLTQQK